MFGIDDNGFIGACITAERRGYCTKWGCECGNKEFRRILRDVNLRGALAMYMSWLEPGDVGEAGDAEGCTLIALSELRDPGVVLYKWARHLWHDRYWANVILEFLLTRPRSQVTRTLYSDFLDLAAEDVKGDRDEEYLQAEMLTSLLRSFPRRVKKHPGCMAAIQQLALKHEELRQVAVQRRIPGVPTSPVDEYSMEADAV